FDRVTGVTSDAPPRVGALTIGRTTGKATLTHYQRRLWRADHQWKVGTQFELGGHDSISVIPTGTRYESRAGVPVQASSAEASHVGGQAMTTSAFVTDATTVKDRVTLDAGVRFDHSRAFSQDLHAVDSDGRETSSVTPGRGTMYAWNLWSPRLGVTA